LKLRFAVAACFLLPSAKFAVAASVYACPGVKLAPASVPGCALPFRVSDVLVTCQPDAGAADAPTVVSMTGRQETGPVTVTRPAATVLLTLVRSVGSSTGAAMSSW